jgi:hypothetical protein
MSEIQDHAMIYERSERPRPAVGDLARCVDTLYVIRAIRGPVHGEPVNGNYVSASVEEYGSAGDMDEQQRQTVWHMTFALAYTDGGFHWPIDLQYHYTDRLSGAQILKAGRIRTHKQTLYKNASGAAGGGHGFTTPPILWLSVNPIIDGTIHAKIAGTRWPDVEPLVQNIWRFVLPKDYATVGLIEYSTAQRIDLAWWKWVVVSGELARAHYMTWRIHSRPIPASDWLRVEVLTGFDCNGRPVWTNRERLTE